MCEPRDARNRRRRGSALQLQLHLHIRAEEGRKLINVSI